MVTSGIFCSQKRILAVLFFLLVLRVSAQQQSLEYYLQQAVGNSPLLNDYNNQLRSLACDSLRIRSLLKPQVNLNSYNTYAPGINGYGYDNVITNGGSYSAMVSATLSFAGKQNLSQKFRALQLQGQSLQATGKISEKELKENITGQYITVYGEQEMLQNMNKIIGIMSEEDVILKKLVDQGVYREIDYLSFLVNYRQQQLAYGQSEMQMKNDFLVLNYSCGVTDTVPARLEKPALGQKEILPYTQTLDYHLHSLDSLTLRNRFDEVKFNYRPRLGVFGDAGYYSSLTYQAQKNFGASTGFSFIVPIYDGGQKQLMYEQLTLSESTLAGYTDFSEKQYRQKVSALGLQIAGTAQLMDEAQRQLTLSDALVQANQKLLLTGDVKIGDYILALTDYVTAQGVVLQLSVTYMQQINAFNYLNN